MADPFSKLAGAILREPLLAIRILATESLEAVLLTFEFREEDGKVLGECLELGTAIYSDSLPEARQELVENVSLQLNEVEQMGFIHDYLREHGLRLLAVPLPGLGKLSSPSWTMPTVTDS